MTAPENPPAVSEGAIDMTATDSAVLAGCPFCGGEAELRDDPGVCDVPFGLVVDHRPGCFFLQPYSSTDGQFVAAWNRRPESADDALLREARDALDGVLTGMGLRPVGAGDGCHTVTVTIPSADQMNAATRALKALNAAQGQKP